MLELLKARSLALILAGAAIAIALSLTSSDSAAQLRVSAQPIGNWWPPHPRDQVHYFSEDTQLPRLSNLVLGTVPPDRWLVIVPQGIEQTIGIQGSSAVKLIESISGQEKLEAVPNGASLGQASKGPSASTPLGWSFAPGSSVVLRNSSSNPQLVSYSLFGY